MILIWVLFARIITDNRATKQAINALISSETQANIFAGKIYFQSYRDLTKYLGSIDVKCEAGNKYFCQRAQGLRQGLSGG